ncbi:MAG TPA: hypothetical protein VFW43_08840, partial [Polaromonas sp.]|nr:hypothetical protein [Polaromonas sp.]
MSKDSKLARTMACRVSIVELPMCGSMQAKRCAIRFSSVSTHQKHFGNIADLSSFVMSGWPSNASVMSISFLRIS